MGDQPSVSAEEWISGVNKDPILISLREGFVATEKPAFVAPEKKASEEEQVPKGEKEVRTRLAVMRCFTLCSYLVLQVLSVLTTWRVTVALPLYSTYMCIGYSCSVVFLCMKCLL